MDTSPQVLISEMQFTPDDELSLSRAQMSQKSEKQDHTGPTGMSLKTEFSGFDREIKQPNPNRLRVGSYR